MLCKGDSSTYLGLGTAFSFTDTTLFIKNSKLILRVSANEPTLNIISIRTNSGILFSSNGSIYFVWSS